MRFKLLVLLFIGFLSSYVGENKANENFCNYKTTAEYHSCLDKSSLPPKIVFPFFIRKLWKYALYVYQDSSSVDWRQIYQLSSNNGKSLIIDKGKLDFFNQFREKNTVEIPQERILGWSVLMNFRDQGYFIKNTRKYTLSYLDENFIEKEINFYLVDDEKEWYGKLEGDVISEFLSAITGLYKNEQRSKNYIDTIIGQKIDDLIKQKEVITAQIKIPNSDLKNCIELNKVKFPELTERTKNIEQKIYSLTSKLDIPTYKKLKPICN